MLRSSARQRFASSTKNWFPALALGLVGVFVVVGIFPAGAAFGATVAASSAPTSTLSPATAPDFPGATAKSADIAVSGIGDTDGYHVRIASESASFIWTDIAVIKPANLDESDWYGYQCLSDDGKYVAVAILPGDSENVTAQRLAGAYAFAINVATHAVTPLASGEGSFYFSPSCGTDDTATFTASLGADQQLTELTRFNLSTGTTVSDSFVKGQVTSAVAVGKTIYGAVGADLVTVPAGGSPATPLGQPATVQKLPGAAYSLQAAQGGGINFLTHATSGTSASLWYYSKGAPARLASGPVSDLQLANGRSGDNIATGYSTLYSGAHIHAVKLTRISAAPGAVSLEGNAAFGPIPAESKVAKNGKVSGLDATTKSTDVAEVEATQTHKLFSAKFNTDNAKSNESQGRPLAGPTKVPGNTSTITVKDSQGKTTAFTTTGPQTLTAAAAFTAVSGADAEEVAKIATSPTTPAPTSSPNPNPTNTATPTPTPTGTPPAPKSTVAPKAAAPDLSPKPALSPGATTPTCAVPRLTPTLQAMQPGNAQVSWAIEMAEQGYLTGSAYTRAANFDNMGLAAYTPSGDFPPVALSHPSSSTTTHVPRSVMEAIVSQESNFNQASWHALPGIAGDPLIADYYGSGGGISTIDYPNADCGYGLAQVTTGMHVGDTSITAHGQMKVAVDYEENVAAGLEILEKTWNQLYAAGITANGGDPKYLENWYFAVWAYNSGIQPTAAYGNTTGCTPSPSCTGADGTWGLGWSNNPANPSYNPARLAYLEYTYADAAHPSSWPYEERIMGWMGSPIVRYGFTAYTAPTYNGGSTWLQIAPYTTFCSTSGDNCNPSTYTCGYSDSECWWHSAVTWDSSCSTTCTTSAYTDGSTTPDPGYTPPGSRPVTSTCSINSSVVPSTAIITDDLATPADNLQSCSGSAWSNSGSFTLTPGTNSSGDPVGDIDIHQLGAGLGGHIYFTHTEPTSSPSLINKGTWAPVLPSVQNYKIKIHLPATGATATDVVYTVSPGSGGTTSGVRVNQDWGSEQWVTIGTFAMGPGGTLSLSNASSMTPGKYDVAFDAVAFIPEGGSPGIPIGGTPTVVDAPNGSNPAWVECGCATRTAGDPVDTASGSFGQTFTDITTPGRGIGFQVARTYSSALADPAGPNGASAVTGPFGPGWTYNYGMTATTATGSGNVTVLQADGSRVTFINSSGTYSPQLPRFNATLTKSGSTYTYSVQGQSFYTFDVTTGHLTAEYDLAGWVASPKYGQTLAYDGSGNLHTVTDPGARVYTFTWGAGHITSIASSAGQSIDYNYNAAGQLTDVYGVGTLRPGGVDGDQDHTQYGYTTTNLMSAFRAPANYGKTGTPTPVTSMIYDTSERVTSQTDPMGNITTFTYGPNTGAGLVAGQTLVTDPSGHKDLETYTNGLLTSETKGYGGAAAETWTYAYDPVSLGVSQETNPDGGVETFSYDDYGNLTSSSDALGRTTSYLYDAMGDLLQKTTPDLIQTTMTYNAAGARTSVTIAQPGQSAESSTSNPSPTVYRSDSVTYPNAAFPADPSVEKDFDGNSTTYTFDADGDMTSKKDAAGNTTKYGWDTTRGLLTSTVTPRGVAAGTTTACTPPAVGCNTFAHDAYGNLTKTTDALGHTTQATFDADGNELTSTDGDSHTTTTAYDSDDRPTLVAQPTGSITTTYNGDSTVHTTSDRAGHTTTYSYDSQGRVMTATDPDGKVTQTGFDADGNTNSETDPNGTVTTSVFDSAGELTSVAYSGTSSAHSVAYTYDAGGRRLTMADATGTSTYAYDTFGEIASYTSGAGATVGLTYDSQGNQTSITYPGSGNTVQKTFNTLNQLATIVDAASRSTSFTYDADGRETLATYPNGTSDATGYNNANQVTSATLNNGTTELAGYTYTRDAAGNETGSTPATGSPGISTTFGYDADEQLTSAVASGSTTATGYDTAGNPTTVGTSTDVFDSADRLCWTTTTTVTSPSCASPATGATRYSSDADGERTTLTPSTGTATTYSWNGAGELAAISGATVATYTYDGDGLRASKTVGGVTTAFTWTPEADDPLLLSAGTEDYIYGPTGAPIEQTGPAGATPDWYFGDAQESTAVLTDATGAVAGTYSYNAHGAVVTHTGTASTPLEFAGQYMDSETGLIYLRARYYDPATALFLSVDPAVGLTGYAFAYGLNNALLNYDPLGLFGLGFWAGTISAGLGVLGLVADATGIGAPVGAILEAGSLAAGAVAIGADCLGILQKADPVGCGFDVAGEVTGGIGAVAGRGAELAGKGLEAANDGVKAAEASGEGVKAAKGVASAAALTKTVAKGKLIGVDTFGVMIGGYGELYGLGTGINEEYPCY